METLLFDQKVIGVGLGRTGTDSLSKALNQLGIKTIHFLDYKLLIQDFKVGEKVFCGSHLFHKLNDVQGIANGTGLSYREIDQKYPGSKFILTIREKHAWLQSKRRYAAFELEAWPNLDPETKKSKRFIRENIYGSFEFDAQRWLKAYDRCIHNVLTFFKDRSADLLIMNIPGGDAWDKLCPFLGLPVPSIPFPHENASQAVSDWNKSVSTVLDDIVNFIPSKSVFILVDDCELGLNIPRSLPFLERKGCYWGRPPDDAKAIAELDRMRIGGSEFIVFVWTTFWWLDHYSEFNRHLHSRFRCVVKNDHVVVFDLRRDSRKWTV